ncbi:hypothetical protein [Paenibacillus sp. N3.4]|uniref:hypothetical protein n=1 Tax=Paenibacillus sp. N3.4 TaxID=2603222 RepID=UPI0011CA5C8D|nr:hypothetical protein [Paenibacillus sp. N3.4]TXK72370.1 hypothetical protein FU659_31455 [Paenibacillus sp. N3.4]
MKFKRVTVQQGKKQFTILQPLDQPRNLWFAEPVIDSRSVLANAEGFAFLRDLFLIAAQSTDPHEWFYALGQGFNERTPTMVTEETRNSYTMGEFDLNLALFNGGQIPIQLRKVGSIHHSLSGLEAETIEIEPDLSMLSLAVEQPEVTASFHVSTTNEKVKMMTIGAEKDILLRLAYLSDQFTRMEDDSKHNFHSHIDQFALAEISGLNLMYYFSA